MNWNHSRNGRRRWRNDAGIHSDVGCRRRLHCHRRHFPRLRAPPPLPRQVPQEQKSEAAQWSSTESQRRFYLIWFDSDSESIIPLIFLLLPSFFCSFLYACVCFNSFFPFRIWLSVTVSIVDFLALILVSDAAELMLLGFISLLLTVFQGAISKLCVPESLTEHLLPCDLNDKAKAEHDSSSGETGSSTTKHFQTFFVSSISGTARRLLAEHSASQTGYCAKKVKVNLTTSIMPAINAHLCLGGVLNHCLVEYSIGVGCFCSLLSILWIWWHFTCLKFIEFCGKFRRNFFVYWVTANIFEIGNNFS